MTTKVPGYYTVDEACGVLDRSHGMVCRYIRQGLLKAIDLGGQLLLEQGEVHEFHPPPRGNPNFRKQDDRNPSNDSGL